MADVMEAQKPLLVCPHWFCPEGMRFFAALNAEPILMDRKGDDARREQLVALAAFLDNYGPEYSVGGRYLRTLAQTFADDYVPPAPTTLSFFQNGRRHFRQEAALEIVSAIDNAIVPKRLLVTFGMGAAALLANDVD